MHWLQFITYFVVALAFFGAVWFGLEKRHGRKSDIRRGRILTKEDFEMFGDEQPTWLWPLNEDKEKNRRGHR